jgi:uncharacterized protein (DUF58 family)
LSAVRRRFIAWARAWSARRHRLDVLPVTVKRGRIYILPTRFGLTLAALLVAMLVAGLNYGNNLAIAFAFLMVSLAIVAMHYCQRNLLGLRLDVQGETDSFVRSAAPLLFHAVNESKLARFEIEIRCGPSARRAFSIAAAGTHALEVSVATAQRGITEIAQWELHTRFPFGWFHAWSYVQSPLKIYVAPAPEGTRALPFTHATQRNGWAAPGEARGDDEFAGLKAYRPGDALKHMAWKVLARGGDAAIQSFHRHAAASEWLDWASLDGLTTEARLSQLCRWVLDAEAAARPFGLRLPERAIAPGLGGAHRRTCLRALAAYGSDAAA